MEQNTDPVQLKPFELLDDIANSVCIDLTRQNKTSCYAFWLWLFKRTEGEARRGSEASSNIYF